MIDFFKQIFSFKLSERNILNPFIGLQITSLGDYSGVSRDLSLENKEQDSSRETPIIVSLASNNNNFASLPITIYSLLNQSLKPDRIILWLDSEYEDLSSLPYEITQFVKNGLEIRFVKSLGKYTKTIYALEEFKKAIVATADDDIFYNPKWLEKLYLSYIANPEDIHVHRAAKVSLDTSFSKWNKPLKKENAEYDNFILSNGGVLYPPSCFTREVLRRDIFLKYAIHNCDLWFWVMAMVHNKKIRIVKNHIGTLIYNNIIKTCFYNLSKNSEKDLIFQEEFQNLLKFYGQNINNKIQNRLDK